MSLAVLRNYLFSRTNIVIDTNPLLLITYEAFHEWEWVFFTDIISFIQCVLSHFKHAIEHGCSVLWFFLKPVNSFSFIKFSIWWYTILSKTFGTRDKTLTCVYFYLSRSSLFFKLGPSWASLRPSEKQLFSKDKFRI